YLTKYGYLSPIDPRNGKIRTDKELKTAIKTLQRFGGFKATGDIEDPHLVDLLNRSRCGMPDVGPADVYKRKRRYLLQGSTWRTTVRQILTSKLLYKELWHETRARQNNRISFSTLKYRIENYTPDLPREEVDNAIRNALAMWAAVTPLTFIEVYDPRIEVEIRIRFVTGDHGDGYPFDGPGGTLAHAFYPHDNTGLSGDAHFDDEEYFTLRTDHGIDLFWVAVHEFGHSLGLDHSSNVDAIMYPFYRGYVPDFQLHYDDKAGVQAIYGTKTSITAKTVEPVTPTIHVDPTEAPGVADKCDPKGYFDTIVQTEEGYSYAFRGEYFWPIGDTGAWTGALKISDFWPGLQGVKDIDAAFYRNQDKVTFIIKGDKFWMFKNRTPLEGKQALPLSDPELALDSELVGMDAALQWAKNGKIYFFKGDRYWRYDPYKKLIDVGYPRLIQEGWNGAVPDNIQAAMQWKNQKSYFFKGNVYWAVDESSFPVKVLEVNPPYPRSIATYWMACSPEKLEGGK
ncbi:predicted protein, partial [Nematostella vectensis]